MRKIAMALILGTLIVAPGIALAEDDNAALAAEYHAKAASAQSEARVHESMAKSYNRGHLKQTQVAAMQHHCGKIAKAQRELAAEYEALAKGHEEAAAAEKK